MAGSSVLRWRSQRRPTRTASIYPVSCAARGCRIAPPLLVRRATVWTTSMRRAAMDDQTVRDNHGHFLPGVSGNPRGRPRGSKNRYPRRRADRGRAAAWTRHDWAVFYKRAFHATDGDEGQKHAVALSECLALWLLLNPPAQRAGLCAQCGRPLDAPNSSVDAAPLRLDGCWTHFGCARFFLRRRWDEANAGLQRLGIGPGSL
jgi:hypothetical protein